MCPESPPDFEEIEHTADWALRINGANLEALLVNAARGMASLVVDQPERVGTEIERQIALEAIDAETLLVDWLSELAYWLETEQILFHQSELTEVSPTRLTGAVQGGRVPDLRKHIKAVPYHGLEITPTASGLTATVVFDV